MSAARRLLAALCCALAAGCAGWGEVQAWEKGNLAHPGMRLEARLSPRSITLARLAPTPFADRLVEKFQLPVVGWRGRGSQEV